ncbi:hypothetical protein F5884DRAFT_904862 [Xylogone sp. PMI_703]|nr:hypothetical protein F5884DRAFT_904862 [Xylogone sp. PMI_703]
MKARSGVGLLALLTIPLLDVLNLALAQASTPQDPDYTCSADKPCAVGCCDKFGICGMGPDFCAPENCVGTCDAKSECDPSGWGPTYALSEGCPLNVCCSPFGFCGTTEEFCGDTTVANPSCTGTSVKRNIGYYEGWSNSRACDIMEPESILASAYTHLNFAFASIDPNSFEVVPASASDVALYTGITGLKRLYPFLQVWISIGGWSMNDPDQPTATTFSDLAGSASAQEAFTNSLISFMSTYGFDGVDIDWEYPVAPERSGRPEDLANYPTFLANIRSAFASAGHNWGLSITLPSSFWYLQNFDIVKLEPIVDWFNMMEYDLHGTWDSTDVWIGRVTLAYVNAHTNLTEIDESLKLLWRNNISPDKVVLGLGFYGRSFALADPSCTAPGCAFTGAAPPGPCTASAGTLSFAEIEDIIASGGTVTLNEAAAVNIVTWDGNWVSYDDATTLKMKVDYANSVCLGGTMVWAVTQDDGSATAAQALAAAEGVSVNGSPGGANVLLANPPTLDSCSFTECKNPSAPGFTQCPAGQSSVFSVTDGCGVTNDQMAQAGTDSIFPHRYYCCPSNQMPTCSWAELNSDGPICEQSPCADGLIKVFDSGSTGSDTGSNLNCVIGSRNMCCKPFAPAITPRTLGCEWVGTPPDCGSASGEAATCPAGTSPIVSTSTGVGGPPCLTGLQTLCCPADSGIDTRTCSWQPNKSLQLQCVPGCSGGQMPVAQDSGQAGCVLGASSFCCDPPASTSPNSADAAAFQDAVEAWLQGGAVCDPTAGSGSPLQDRAGGPTSFDIASLLAPVLRPGSSNANQALFKNAWNAAITQNPGATALTFDLIEAAVDPSITTDYDETLSLNEALCNTVDPGTQIDLNQHSSDLCPPINAQLTGNSAQPCPSFTEQRMQNQFVAIDITGDLQAWDAFTDASIDMTTGVSFLGDGIFKQRTDAGVCRMQYGSHVEIVGNSASLPPLARRQNDPLCSLYVYCINMHIIIPPGKTLWSYMTIPQGEGSPQDFTTNPNGESTVRGSGSIINNYSGTDENGFRTAQSFAHSATAERCSWYYTFIDTQVDNFGVFLSYNCQGYPECVFSRYNVVPGSANPSGTGPPTNPGNF